MTSLQPVLDILQGALTFIIVMPILVAVHELGHFWVARFFGMDVHAFAVMMGGVRKTDLKPYLEDKLAPAWQVWVFGLIAVAALVVGAVTNSVVVAFVGLFLTGVALPVWIVTRLGALYHLPLPKSIGVLLKAWGMALVLSFFATRAKGLDAAQLLGLTTIASFIGTLIVYYNPVFNKGDEVQDDSEENPQGHGQIAIEGDTGPEAVKVRFRPLAYCTDKHGTEFSFLCWPLGGFATIKGMQPREDGSETQIKNGFYSKSPFARLCVLFAGPLFSVLFGIVLLAGNLAIFGKLDADKAPFIGKIVEAGPAATAGLKVGDRFVSVNGSTPETFFDVVKATRTSLKKSNKGGYESIPINVTVDRGGKRLDFKVVPKVDEKESDVLGDDMKPIGKTAIQAKMNIGPKTIHVPLGAGEAFAMAAKQPFEMIVGLAKSFSKPATLGDNIGGPAAVAQQLTEASKQGLEVLIGIAGLLSMSLGIMNLLPIVPFDGGQMVIAFAEMLRGGKRLSIQLQSNLSTIGAFLIFALMVTIVSLDISRFAK